MYRGSLDELCNLINSAQEVVWLDPSKNDISHVLCEFAMEDVGAQCSMDPYCEQDYVWNAIEKWEASDFIYELPFDQRIGLWEILLSDGSRFVIKLKNYEDNIWQIGLGIKNAN